MFGYTTKTAAQLMRKGLLPGKKVGGEWRMHRRDFEQITRPQLAPVAAPALVPSRDGAEETLPPAA